jgi:hypothetical protein
MRHRKHGHKSSILFYRLTLKFEQMSWDQAWWKDEHLIQECQQKYIQDEQVWKQIEEKFVIHSLVQVANCFHNKRG